MSTSPVSGSLLTIRSLKTHRVTSTLSCRRATVLLCTEISATQTAARTRHTGYTRDRARSNTQAARTRGGSRTVRRPARSGSGCGGWRRCARPNPNPALARGGALCLWRLHARPPDTTSAARNERRGERSPQPEGVGPGGTRAEDVHPAARPVHSEPRTRLRGEGIGRRTHL
jgi:hypothetical protein